MTKRKKPRKKKRPRGRRASQAKTPKAKIKYEERKGDAGNVDGSGKSSAANRASVAPGEEPADQVARNKDQAQHCEPDRGSHVATQEADRGWRDTFAIALSVIALGCTGWQIYASREQEKLASRAWVTVQQPGSNADLSKFIVRLGNTGTTPALNVTVVGRSQRLDPGTLPTFEYESNTVSGKGALGRDVQAQLEVPYVVAKDKVGFIHGCVDYDDIFGQRHWTTFCFRQGSDSGHATWCDEHNGTGSYQANEQSKCKLVPPKRVAPDAGP